VSNEPSPQHGDPASEPVIRGTKAPKVSIVMCFFEAEDRVDHAVSELAGLDYPNFEAILIDDGSTDGTAAALQRATADVKGFRVESLAQNAGAAEARNHGLRLATGDYVWFPDDDDAWEPDIVRRLAEAAISSGADIAICRARATPFGSAGVEAIDAALPEGTYTGDQLIEHLLRGEAQGHLWNKLFRRSTIAEVRFPSLSIFEDHPFVVEAALRARTVQVIDDTLYTYVRRQGSLASSLDAAKIKTKKESVSRILELVREDDELRDPRLLELFEVQALYLPAVNALAADQALWRSETTLRGSMLEHLTFSRGLRLLRASRSTGIQVLLAAVLGPAYGALYRVVRSSPVFFRLAARV